MNVVTGEIQRLLEDLFVPGWMSTPEVRQRPGARSPWRPGPTQKYVRKAERMKKRKAQRQARKNARRNKR